MPCHRRGFDTSIDCERKAKGLNRQIDIEIVSEIYWYAEQCQTKTKRTGLKRKVGAAVFSAKDIVFLAPNINNLPTVFFSRCTSFIEEKRGKNQSFRGYFLLFSLALRLDAKDTARLQKERKTNTTNRNDLRFYWQVKSNIVLAASLAIQSSPLRRCEQGREPAPLKMDKANKKQVLVCSSFFSVLSFKWIHFLLFLTIAKN